MQIFLTGATGYIGTVLAAQLQAAGHSVIGLTHSKARAAELGARNIEPVIGDLREPAFLVELARAADGVIHTGILLDEGIARAFEVDYQVVKVLTEALAGSGKPLLVSSSPVSLGDTGSYIRDENTPVDWTSSRAKIDRLALDAAQSNIRSVVLRVPLYPYGRAGSVFVPLLVRKALETGASYYIGDGQNKISAVHVDDVARLYHLALENAPRGSLYHIATQNGITGKSLAEAVGRLTNTPAKSISLEEAAAIYGEFAVPLAVNNQIDAAKARRELGWQAEGTPALLDDIEHGSYRQLIALLNR